MPASEARAGPHGGSALKVVASSGRDEVRMPLGTGQSNGNLLQETSVPEEVDSIGKGKRCIVDCGGRGLAVLDG